MAYDEDLANRIRELLADQSGVTEQKMFGGLAFLVDGRMAIAASGQGGAMVHVDAEQGERLIATTSATPMEMRGKEMSGWLRIAAEDLSTKRQLARWVDVGASYARSLPPKDRKR